MKSGDIELKKSGTYTEEKIPKLRKILRECRKRSALHANGWLGGDRCH